MRAALLAILLVFTPLAHADIHALIGPDGRLHVADQALPGTHPFNPLLARPKPMTVATKGPARRLPRADHLDPLIAQAGQGTGVDAALLHAVVQVESGYNPRAVSRTGAAGLMQLMPATAKRFGVRDRFDPLQNLRGGASYLAWLRDHFDGNLELALAAYNAGEGAVRRHGNRIPPYPETRSYVRKVLSLYQQ